MANFDTKQVTPIEWAGIGAGALAFLISFFPWYSFSWDGGGLGIGATSDSASAWSVGIGGWGAVLLLVAAAVIIVLPHVGTTVPNKAALWLGFAAAATVIILIRWLTLPDDGGLGALAGGGFSSGAGFGLIIGLIAAVVSGVAAFLYFQGAKKATA